MQQQAEIINFSTASCHDSFLYRLKNFIKHSTHSHEQLAYSLICDLEELVGEGILSLGELEILSGKAVDILSYFRFDFNGLVHGDAWYRASVIHQMSCGMLQTLRTMRPDLHNNSLLCETAYYLYRYHWPLENMDTVTARPLRCQSWS